jgi:hypothetical protein
MNQLKKINIQTEHTLPSIDGATRQSKLIILAGRHQIQKIALLHL